MSSRSGHRRTSSRNQARAFLITASDRITRIGWSLILELDVAEPGDTQVAYGRGFLPGEAIDGLLESTPIDLGAQTADPTGAVTFTIVLPLDIEAGPHRVTLTGESRGEVAEEFEVVLPAPGPGQPPVLDRYAPPTPPSASLGRRPGPSAWPRRVRPTCLFSSARHSS